MVSDAIETSRDAAGADAADGPGARKIAVDGLTKVFGSDPDEALDLLGKGHTKDDILRETGQTVGVQEIGFEVAEGETFVVMGLSGSGKSTLVRMLNGLIPATSGSVRIDGEDVLGADARTLRQIRLDKVAMVFQHFALFPHRTVRDNVEYGLKVKGVRAAERRRRADAALEQVGLADWGDHRPKALSGGMQQRVGLARGLAVDPEILLMDEPFSALDPLIRRDMQNELIELQRSLRKTIVFITHDLHEALILGDRIAIMKEGRFVQVGTAEEIVGAPADDYVADFTKDIDRSRVFHAERALEDAHALAPDDGAATALERMRETGRPALHLVESGRAVGLVTWRDVETAADGGGGWGWGWGDLRALARTDFPAARRDTQLFRLFGACARGLPIAVTDDAGRLHGVLRPEAVFEQLAIAGDDGRAAA